MRAATARETSTSSRLPIPALAVLVLVFTLATLASMWPLVEGVMAGAYTDPDDAMRLVEVRAWLAGQSWFDVSAIRLDPPIGASMHWSRLVDVPNGLLIRFFGCFADTSMAEKLDRIVLPTLLLAGLYWGIARLAFILLGRPARLPALVGLFFSGLALVLFQPGRIGHHAPDSLALVVALGCVLHALDPRYAREAAIAGCLVALSLGMSLETMPFLAVLCGALVLAWIRQGEALARTLGWFAGSLALALPLIFLATVPPARWLAAPADALGLAHLGTGLIAALGCLALAAATSRLGGWPRRLAGAGLVAAAAFAFVVIACPAVLRGPFAGVDPEVRAAWLDHVVESQPWLVFMQQRPSTALAIAVPTALGLVGCLVAVLRSGDETTRLRFAIVATLVATGLLLGLWQIRVFTSVAPMALLGGLPLVDAVRTRLIGGGMRFAGALALPAILPFSASIWAAVLPAEAEPGAGRPSCLAPEAIAPLAGLPPGRVVAPINEGSHILAATTHTVFAAPYHRNNDGNRYALDVLYAAPEQAKGLLAARKANYVMICPSAGETQRLGTRAPAGLAARLAAGDVPDFLSAVPLAGTPWRVFAVTASGS